MTRITATSRDVLVTPVWQRSIADADERWNLNRSLQAMPDVDHVLLAPRALDTTWYRECFPRSRVLRGPDSAFEGVDAYSRTMLDARLYRSFLEYRFLVVVQLDAVLVRDLRPVLDHADWDLVGAPFVEPHRLSALTILSRRAGDLEERVRARTVVPVGNGGLSVRRVRTMVRVLERRPWLSRFARVNEDLVLGFLGERGALRVADAAQASRLLVERMQSSVEGAGPYGYHALQRWQPDAYRRLRAEPEQQIWN